MAIPNYNAVIRQDGKWWIGWIEEIPGVNSQGATRDELLANLREALSEALELERLTFACSVPIMCEPSLGIFGGHGV